jgi:hypothetical protein
MDNDKFNSLFENEQDTLALGSGSQIRFKGDVEAVMLNIDCPEGKGKILIERGASGVYIWVNGHCLGLIDLFYFSEECRSGVVEGDPVDFPQFIFYSERDDALGHIRWLEDRIQVLVDRTEAVHLKDYYRHKIIVDEGIAP